MRAREDIVRALRCSASTEGKNCSGCPYLIREKYEGMVWRNCDCDRIALDAAEMLETDKMTIRALVEDRKYYMEKCEELESQVPQHNYVLPEEGAEDDEA